MEITGKWIKRKKQHCHRSQILYFLDVESPRTSSQELLELAEISANMLITITAQMQIHVSLI